MSGLKLKITTKYSKKEEEKKTDDKTSPKKLNIYYVLHNTLTPAS